MEGQKRARVKRQSVDDLCDSSVSLHVRHSLTELNRPAQFAGQVGEERQRGARRGEGAGAAPATCRAQDKPGATADPGSYKNPWYCHGLWIVQFFFKSVEVMEG